MPAVKGGPAANYRTIFQDVSVQGNRGAADTSVSPLIAARTGTTLFVQEIWVNITIDAAQTITFRPIVTTARTILFINSNPGLGEQTFTYGDEGYALPEGEGLELILSAAGLAFDYKVVGYRRQTGVITAAQFASAT
jgi:hypothetical protein